MRFLLGRAAGLLLGLPAEHFQADYKEKESYEAAGQGGADDAEVAPHRVQVGAQLKYMRCSHSQELGQRAPDWLYKSELPIMSHWPGLLDSTLDLT